MFYKRIGSDSISDRSYHIKWLNRIENKQFWVGHPQLWLHKHEVTLWTVIFGESLVQNGRWNKLFFFPVEKKNPPAVRVSGLLFFTLSLCVAADIYRRFHGSETAPSVGHAGLSVYLLWLYITIRVFMMFGVRDQEILESFESVLHLSV